MKKDLFITRRKIPESKDKTEENIYLGYENLKYAKEFFAKEIHEFYSKKNLEGLSQIYQKLTLQLMFNIHEMEDDYDVFSHAPSPANNDVNNEMTSIIGKIMVMGQDATMKQMLQISKG